MTRVGITQRVDCSSHYAERRDCLDQRWFALFAAAQIQLVALPNDPVGASGLVNDLDLCGIVFSGGNSLVKHGGDAPERDHTEHALLELAASQCLPILGVCRGMQLLQDYCGVNLLPLDDHVLHKQVVRINGNDQTVNSFHTWGTRDTCAALEVWAQSTDGVVKAVSHRQLPWLGIMWHPERIAPFRSDDMHLLRHHFGSAVA